MRTRLVKLAVALVAAIGTCLVAYPRAALADPSSPTCSDPDDTCEIEAEQPGSGGGVDTDLGDEGGAAPAPAPGGGGDTGALTDCTSRMIKDAKSHPLAGERPNDKSVLVIETCTTETGSSIQSAEWVELGAEGQMRLSTEVLAQRAVDRLVLLKPGIEASPEAEQLVHLPTWLWVSETTWTAQTAQAAAGDLTATATATPVSVAWDMGDGATVECTGRGIEWIPGTDPKAASECGHTYQQPSDSELPVTAAVTWRVTWVVTDAEGEVDSGSEPDMTTTATVTWQVRESQAVGQ